MSWTVVLDELEAELDAFAALEVSDVRTMPAFRPPVDLEPLPAALAPRAISLARRIDECTDAVSLAMASAQRSADAAGTLSGRGPRPAASLDVRL